MSTDSSERQEFWVSPCGGDGGTTTEIVSSKAQAIKDYLSVIIRQCETTLETVKVEVEEFLQIIFNVSLESHHKLWQHRNETWIYNGTNGDEDLTIPKIFDKSIDGKYAQALVDLDSTDKHTDVMTILLLQSYERFQRLAVGIEQIKSDMQNEDIRSLYDRRETDSLARIFDTIKIGLRNVLCEVNDALIGIKADRRPDVERFPLPVKNYPDDSNRKLRDWIICREFMNQLQFNVEALSILQSKVQLYDN